MEAAYAAASREIIRELVTLDPGNGVAAVMKAAQETINGNNAAWLKGALQLPHALAQLVPMLRKVRPLETPSAVEPAPAGRPQP